MKNRINVPKVRPFGIIILLIIGFVFIACKGPTGPQGDPGETGPQGPQGDPGHIHTYDNGICSGCYAIVMVQIAGGNFQMGQTSIAPVRTVTVSAFRMSKYAVTQELYQAVTGVNPSNFQGAGNLPAGGEIQGKRPVEAVTWYDAVEFCNKLSEREGLTPVYTISGRTPGTGYPITAATVTPDWTKNGYRLPTEAEREYACRAGTTTIWIFGDIDTNAGDYAWIDTNASSRTHQVGKKLPNAWGLYDMHGNVYEWCWDWYATYVDNPPNNNPTGPETTGTDRVIRGGSWHNSAESARSAHRNGNYPSYRNNIIGIRVVRAF